MSKKETLRQKAIRIGLSAVQIIFTVFALFFLFGIVVSLFNWIVSGLQDAYMLLASSIFFGMFLFFAFVIALLEKGLLRLRPRREAPVSFKESLKQFGLILLMMSGLVSAIYVLNQYFAQFPKAISVSLELEILKTIIQANGFLIGLSGIVFAQMFWAINHQQNTIQMDIIQNPKLGLGDLGGDIRKVYVAVLDRKRRSMTITMSFVIGLFILSIASSLSGMARTESYVTGLAPTNPDIANPIILMVSGIAFFVFSIATSKMSLEGEAEKLEKK